MRIIRGNEVILEGTTNASKMRRIEKQIKYLIRNNDVPDGTLLSTGTAIVPGRDKGLRHGDIVEITITKI